MIRCQGLLHKAPHSGSATNGKSHTTEGSTPALPVAPLSCVKHINASTSPSAPAWGAPRFHLTHILRVSQ